MERGENFARYLEAIHNNIYSYFGSGKSSTTIEDGDVHFSKGCSIHALVENNYDKDDMRLFISALERGYVSSRPFDFIISPFTRRNNFNYHTILFVLRNIICELECPDEPGFFKTILLHMCHNSTFDIDLCKEIVTDIFRMFITALFLGNYWILGEICEILTVRFRIASILNKGKSNDNKSEGEKSGDNDKKTNPVSDVFARDVETILPTLTSIVRKLLRKKPSNDIEELFRDIDRILYNFQEFHDLYCDSSRKSWNVTRYITPLTSSRKLFIDPDMKEIYIEELAKRYDIYLHHLRQDYESNLSSDYSSDIESCEEEDDDNNSCM